MAKMLSIILNFLLALLVSLFIIQAAIELWAAKKKAKQPGIQQEPEESGFLPSVSILLPVYNEKKVIAKLLNSVCSINYPADRLEILLLDDSNDETGQIADTIIETERAKGINIRRLKHDKPCGFKAGNLAFGLAQAKGEFIAIFDADCVPPPHFLNSTLPFFKDEKVGFLQTGIGYHNTDASFLTRFQAAEAAHKEDMTTGFSAEGHMASLTGSSCIWRRKCLDDIGGIRSTTITEDVDMGYAAQLRKWKYKFTQKVCSLAELPETMAGFRVQRQRWARGLVHNAVLHLSDLLTCHMGAMAKLHACALIFSPLLLALFYALLLLAPFIALLPQTAFFHVVCLIFLCTTVIWGWANTTSHVGPETEKRNPIERLLFTIAYVLLFFPLSLYYFSAIIQVALAGKGNFHTTPKGCGRSKVRHPAINKILLGMEIFSLFWSLGVIYLSIIHSNYWTMLYSILAGSGFGMGLAFSIADSLKQDLPSNILITGASGSIGSAFAQEYAAPGILLTLQGRNEEKLQNVAAKCRSKGACVQIEIVDLLKLPEVESFAQKMARSGPPDLLIVNAGLNTDIGADCAGEPYEKSLDLVRVNLISAMALVNGVLPAMRKRGSGQIAIVSSLAGCYGLPTTPTYCATKAALRSWGQSLRGWLASEGIRVNVILPGYVESPMCAAMPGPKPFLWQPERAAKKIRRGLQRNRARISFPFPLNLGIWALALLPDWLARTIARILGYGR